MYKDIFDSIRYEAAKRNLRESTIRLYCNDVRYFLRFTGKSVSSLTLHDVESFLNTKRLEGRSPETLNHYRASIKFLYKKVLKNFWDDDVIPPMKRERHLPAVLSRSEMEAVINNTTNLKYKAMIAIMYSSGLRLSEVIHLHYEDISRSDMTIHVRQAKGRIDRYSILSKRALDILTSYWFAYGKPMDILFPSSSTGTYLTANSVNDAFKKSAKQAGITRRVSSHACRHSFATHLFENGASLPYIQSLLGHTDPRSTMVYIHLSNKSLLQVASPFDCPEGGR